MQKKNKEVRKWQVAQICNSLQNELQNDSKNGTDGSDDRQHGMNDGTASLTRKATFIQTNPSFIGYLYAIFVLFKKAFCHKKADNFIVIR